MDSLFGLVFVAIGAFSIFGGFTGWGWFMNNSKAKVMISLFSYMGARIFYCVLGLALVVGGLLVIAGVVDLGR
jgi:hypothetical protein